MGPLVWALDFVKVICIFICLPFLSHAFSCHQDKNICYQRTNLKRKISSSQVSMTDTAFFSTAGSAAVIAGVIAFHEAGHFFAAKWQGMKVQSYNIGYGPKLFSFNDTDQTEFALRAFPFGGYVAFPTNTELNEEGDVIAELTDPNLLQNRPPLQRAVVICAGVIANILLTFLLSTGVAITSGISIPTYDSGILVTGTPISNSPAVRAGIRTSDVIVKFDNEYIKGSASTIEEFISKVRANADKPLAVELDREGTTVITTVTPEKAANGKGTIGLGVSNRIASVEKIIAKNPVEAVIQGSRETKLLVEATWNTFVRTIKTGFTGDEVGGPIAVVQTGAKMAQLSPTALIGFAATLSVNLAVLNALPFPALDGGQLVFVLIESALGKPLPRKFQDIVTTAAFLLLLTLGVGTFVSDIGRLGSPPTSIMR